MWVTLGTVFDQDDRIFWGASFLKSAEIKALVLGAERASFRTHYLHKIDNMEELNIEIRDCMGKTTIDCKGVGFGRI